MKREYGTYWVVRRTLSVSVVLGQAYRFALPFDYSRLLVALLCLQLSYFQEVGLGHWHSPMIDLSIAALRFDLLSHDISTKLLVSSVPYKFPKNFCMIQRGLRTFTTLYRCMTEGQRYTAALAMNVRDVYSDCVCLTNSVRLHAVSYSSFCIIFTIS